MINVVMLILGLLAAVPAYALDGNEILARVDKNLAPDSYEMYRKLINVEPDGSKRSSFSLR